MRTDVRQRTHEGHGSAKQTTDAWQHAARRGGATHLHDLAQDGNVLSGHGGGAEFLRSGRQRQALQWTEHVSGSQRGGGLELLICREVLAAVGCPSSGVCWHEGGAFAATPAGRGPRWATPATPRQGLVQRR